MNFFFIRYPMTVSITFYDTGHSVAKRVFDICIAFVTLCLLAPVFAIVALVVMLDSPGGAIFAQERVGRNNQKFRLFKFRSMRQGTPNISTAEMQKNGVSHVTRIGTFLRRTSLDELPQLVNVLRGEMSLVGPRPALPAQTHLNELRTESGVADLLPGITGWAQINGRDELTDTQKVAHDVYYYNHRSLRLDMVILFRTASAVFTGRGNR